MLESIGESEIGNDDVSMFIKQQILELEITMDNVFLVKIVDTRDQLRKELLCILLFQVPACQNMVK